MLIVCPNYQSYQIGSKSIWISANAMKYKLINMLSKKMDFSWNLFACGNEEG